MNGVIERLKKKQFDIQDLQRQEERRRGRLEQTMQQLKQEHGLNSLEEAQAEIEKINKNITVIDEKLEKLDLEMGKILENAKCGSST